MQTMEAVFREIREASARNEDILGFVVTGSRGKGFENQWSDYDFAIFVKEEAFEKYRRRYRQLPQRLLREAKRVCTLAGYGEYFEWPMARFSLNYSPTSGAEGRG